MLSDQDKDILRNFDKYLAQAAVTDPVLARVSAQNEGASGPEYKGNVDEQALTAAIAPGFILITPDGARLGSKSMVSSLSGGNPDVEFKHGQMETLHSNDAGDTAWMTGTLEIQASLNGGDISGKYRSTGVFTKRGGQWHQVLLHLTAIVGKG